MSCQARLQGFGAGLQVYTNASQDFIPGVNTSGLATRAKNGVSGALNPHSIPVQSLDWMTPLLQDDPGLPDNRAARFNYLYSHYQCPEQTHGATLNAAGLNASPDKTDFLAYSSWPAASYLMPICFSNWGDNFRNTTLGFYEANPAVRITAQTIPTNWEVSNLDYQAHVDQVGPPASKVFVADGTRYVFMAGMIDINVDPVPITNPPGAFGSFGAWWCQSTEYGVKGGSRNWDNLLLGQGSPSLGLNLPISYRHVQIASGLNVSAAPGRHFEGADAGEPQQTPGASSGPQTDGTAQGNPGLINALFFDGHVAQLTDRQSREISLWYPTGSTVQLSSQGMTNVPNGTIIP